MENGTRFSSNVFLLVIVIEQEELAMGEKFTVFLGSVLLMFAIPYGITMLTCGKTLGSSGVKESGILVSYEEAGKNKTMDLEQYLVGVLAAELPYDYEPETYKTLAVILRTNARKLAMTGEVVQGSDISSSYWTDEEWMNQIGEVRAEEQKTKIKKAVYDTFGEVATYQGTYIDALYHTASMGRTISAAELYGQDIPYLKSVSSEQDVESKDYIKTYSFSYEELTTLLSKYDQETKGQTIDYGLAKEQFPGNISITEKTESGYVKKLQVGNASVAAEDFQKALKLSSLYFSLEADNGACSIVCLGKGHGMGVSLFGANVMAKEGKSYKDILLHYYTGISLEKIGE